MTSASNLLNLHEQEKHRQIRNENRENDRRRKIATRRQIVVGGLVAKYFPGVLNLQPQLKQVDTEAEFAGLEIFVSTVAADPTFYALFQELMGEGLTVGNTQEQ